LSNFPESDNRVPVKLEVTDFLTYVTKNPYIICYYHEYNPNKNLVFNAVMLKVAFQACNFIHYKY